MRLPSLHCLLRTRPAAYCRSCLLIVECLMNKAKLDIHMLVHGPVRFGAITTLDGGEDGTVQLELGREGGWLCHVAPADELALTKAHGNGAQERLRHQHKKGIPCHFGQSDVEPMMELTGYVPCR